MGEGGFRGPRAAARELFPSAGGAWPPRAVAWRFLLWESASCQGHVSNDHRRVLALLGGPGKGQFVVTRGGEERQTDPNAKGPLGRKVNSLAGRLWLAR